MPNEWQASFFRNTVVFHQFTVFRHNKLVDISGCIGQNGDVKGGRQMRVLLLTADRRTARAYAEAAEETGLLRLHTLKNTAQVLERLFRDPFDALLSEDVSILLPQVRRCAVPWPEHLFLLSDRTIESLRLPEYLTFCFSKDSDPKAVLARIARFPNGKSRKGSAEETISRFLRQIGVPVFLNGFDYLRTALGLILSQGSMTDVKSINQVYSILSMIYGISAYVAEHAIRHAIDAAWIRADTGMLERLFGYTVRPDRGVPSNAAFLFRAADHIRLKEKGEVL